MASPSMSGRTKDVDEDGLPLSWSDAVGRLTLVPAVVLERHVADRQQAAALRQQVPVVVQSDLDAMSQPANERRRVTGCVTHQ